MTELTDIKLTLPGVQLLKPRRFADARGYFVETYNAERFRQSGIMVHFVQDNQSFSRSGPWLKIVTCRVIGVEMVTQFGVEMVMQ